MSRLWGYARASIGILRELDSPAHLINSVTDPAHILFVLSKNVALAKAVEYGVQYDEPYAWD